jgi:hypothetical protein
MLSWGDMMNHEPSDSLLRLLATASPLVQGLLADLLATEEGRSSAEANVGLLVAQAEYIATL